MYRKRLLHLYTRNKPSTAAPCDTLEEDEGVKNLCIDMEDLELLRLEILAAKLCREKAEAWYARRLVVISFAFVVHAMHSNMCFILVLTAMRNIFFFFFFCNT